MNVSTTCFWRVSWLKDLSGSKEKHLHFIIYLVTESFSVSSPQLYSGYMELHLRVVYLFDNINNMVECYGAQYNSSLLILNLQGFFSNLCGKDSMPASSFWTSQLVRPPCLLDWAATHIRVPHHQDNHSNWKLELC